MPNKAKRYRRIYAVSDIHGDYEGLTSVLSQIIDDGFDEKSDLFIQLGDIIDGYEHSKHCVELLYTISKTYKGVVLLGNHEDLLLRSVGKHEGQSDFRAWWYQGGEATFRSYEPDSPKPFLYNPHNRMMNKVPEKFQPKGELADHIDWFKTLPLSFETEDFIFVHAGLRPHLTAEATSRWDKLWIREEFVHSSYDWGKVVVFGHTAFAAPLIEKNKIGIDTRHRGQGCVTAVRLEDGQSVSFFHGPRD